MLNSINTATTDTNRPYQLQRLHLAFLVHAQDQRLVGRIQLQTHDVADLLYGEPVGGELEALGAMRLQAEQREVATHRALAMPLTSAPLLTLQWVACSGLRCDTSLINSATCSSSWVRGRPGRNWSCNPASPRSWYRRRQWLSAGAVTRSGAPLLDWTGPRPTAVRWRPS